MRASLLRIGMLFVVLWFADGVWAQEPVPGDPPPLEIGLEERIGRRIVTIDISVRGPRELVSTLQREDFRLIVDRRYVESFTVDNLCPAAPPTTSGEAVEAPGESEPASVEPLRPRVNYVFYIDQQHLTQRGRVNAILMTRKLIEQLITHGSRGIVFSNGVELQAFSPFTEDAQALLQGLATLDADKGAKRQWDPAAVLEDGQVDEIKRTLQKDGIQAAQRLARRYQQEESRRARRAQDRLVVALQTLADAEPPKLVFYFADTMRRNAGQHYAELFSPASSPDAALSIERAGLTAIEASGSMSAHGFDLVSEESAANGIRVYAIRGEGLTSQSTPRSQDSQETLRSFALETGGRFFLGSDLTSETTKVANAVGEDLSCMYLLSFDPPERLKEDALLAVRVELDPPRKGVELVTRGQIVIPSKSRRDTTRLLATFASADVGKTEAIRAAVIPTGFKDGKYTSLVQAAVPGSPLSASVWDVGLSVVGRGRVEHQISARVETSDANVPVVLEAEIDFEPGEYTVVMVAREEKTGTVARGELQLDWPRSTPGVALAGPIAVVRPFAGIFVRNGRATPKSAGALALAANGDFADPAHPSTLAGVVCRGSTKQRLTLKLQSRLAGQTAVDFPEMDLAFEPGERCVMILNDIPPGAMGTGEFVYSVDLVGRLPANVAQAELGQRKFVAIRNE